MKIEETTLKIPSLTREYLFLQISDIHVSYANSKETQDHRTMVEEQNRMWSPAGILPEETMDLLKDYIVQSEVPIDGVLMAGDCMNFYTAANFALFQEKYQALSTEILYTPGNHEHWVISSKEDAWEHMGSLMQENASFWVRDYDQFLIVGIDNAKHIITDQQVDFLKQQMKRNLPILLLVHIPFYSEAVLKAIEGRWGTPDPYFVFETKADSPSAKEFCTLIRDPQNPIAGVFAGHIHTAHTGEYAPGKMQYVSAPLHDLYVRRITLQPA